jgi:prepilin-type N-terminal cleavage/methylation domain-containing protein
MLTKHFSHRSGMSLTELLVVIAILGLLSITVIPALNSNNESRRTRAASRAVSSYLAKAQARSVGRTTWSGFRILASSSTSFAADRVVVVDCPEPYRGDSATAAVNVSVGFSGTATPVNAGDFTRLSNGSLTVTDNDVIRFDGRGPTYQVMSANSLPILFSLRNASSKENLGQSAVNTPWPSAGSHSIEIFRQPIPAGTPFQLPDDRAIDLQWSGYGPAVIGGALTSSFPQGSNVTVLCDNSGRVRQYSVTTAAGVTTTRTASVPLFLLIGRADRAANPQASLDPNDDTVGANWQYADSWWLAMDPSSGIVKASECNATATTFADSQLFIRQALTNTVGKVSAGGN